MKTITLLAMAMISFASFAAAEQKMPVCHKTAEGMTIDILVSSKALPAFERQGDYIRGTCQLMELEDECGDVGLNASKTGCYVSEPPPPVDGGVGGYEDEHAVDEPFDNTPCEETNSCDA